MSPLPDGASHVPELTEFRCQICDNTGHVNRGHSDGVNRGEDGGYDLHQCTACGTVVIAPLPTPEVLDDIYSRYRTTDRYEQKRDKKLKRSRRRIARLKNYVTGNRFLDVGCSLGYTVAAALELGMDAHGIDIDPVTIESAQNSFGADRFTATTIADFAEGDETFDILYTAETIEHTLDPHAFMAASSKLLNPQGLLYLTTPDAGHLRVPKDITTWNEIQPPIHIFHLTKNALTLMLRRHGLSLVKFQLNMKPGIRLLARKA